MFETITDVLFLKDHNTRVVIISVMLLGVSSGIIGAFLLLRKRSLMGDVLSHATLPGIGLAFAVMTAMGFSGKSLAGLLLGAAITGVAGLLTMLAIRSTTRLRDDAAMGFVLSVFFGLGVAVLGMVQKLPGANAAGLESFIYGKTASMVLQDALLIGGMALVINLGIVVLLFKELRLSSFDPALAETLGFFPGYIHYLLMTMVAVTTVAAFESVGSIIVIAMLIVPAATAMLLTRRLIPMIFIACGVGAASSWIGHYMAIRIPPVFGISDTTSSGMMAFATGMLFTLVWIFIPHEGLLARFLCRCRTSPVHCESEA
mgnify:CR=1 FL=1